MSETPKLLSVSQACRQLGIGRTSLYRFIAEGKLQTVKLGKRTLFTPEALERFVELMTVECWQDRALVGTKA